jgi:membrane-associated phospholipid phosphatase
VPAPAARPAPPPADARAACALLAAYLAAAAVPLAGAAARGGGAARAALPAHAALLALALWGARRAPGRAGAAGALAEALAAWLPLLAVPALYAGLPAIAAALAGRAAGPAPMHDAQVLAWERALFGAESPAVALAARWPLRPLSELLHLGYLSYYLVIYLPPLLLWRAARRPGPAAAGAGAAFAASAFTVLLAFVACYAVFLPFPVQGPWYTWPHPPAVPAGPVRAAVERLLHAGSSRGTAFPSSHVAVSLAQTLALARTAPRLAAPAAAATALLAAGAVYGGFHYGVDVLAGAAVGLAAGLAGPRALARRRGRTPRA